MSINYGKTVSCDFNGEWIDEVEVQHEKEFMDMLHTSSSYEEFKMKSDLALSKFDVSYFGLSSLNDLDCWLKVYYERKV